MKRIFVRFASLFLLCIAQFSFAGTGLFFEVSASGTGPALNIVLCLNAKSPVTCQNYTVSGSNLSIKTTIPNHQYPLAGIKVTTPGYTPTNCTLIADGSCTFPANSTTPATVKVTDGSPQVTIGGSVVGLIGSVVLQNNGGDNLTMGSDGSFTFGSTQSVGSTYNVTVLTQPPMQTCSVSNGSGTANANVTNVTVTCSTNTYNIGGTVSGLSGTVVLQNNGGDDQSINSDGGFTFSTPIADGSPYNVTVLTQPATQTCTVSNGSGTVNGSNITNVSVTCSTNTYTVGGTVSGLRAGQSVVLQNNASDNSTINTNSSFTFATPVADGSPYNVTVFTQPTTQTCSVTNGSGTMGSANVTNVSVSCSDNVTTLSVPATATIAMTGGPSCPADCGGCVTSTVSVTNTGAYPAYNISAQLPWSVGVNQDVSNCATLAPGQSCSLTFCAVQPYIAAGNISVSGDNISSPPTMAMAFTYSNNYLVVSVDSPSQLSVIDNADLSSARWGGVLIPAANSLYGGKANTTAIVSNGSTGAGAATNCNNSINGGVAAGTWYLPAICQMTSSSIAGCTTSNTATIERLVSLGFLPTLNNQTYWSSTAYDDGSNHGAWNQQYGSTPLGGLISTVFRVRCMLALSY